MDRWSQLNTTARSWKSAVKGGRVTEKCKAEAASIDFMSKLEVKEIQGTGRRKRSS
jgi:hypothetical protein